MPLSYGCFAPLLAPRVQQVARPDQADLFVFAHPQDIGVAPQTMVEEWRRRRVPFVLLSEEPFWDTLWGVDPTARHVVMHTALGAVPVVQLLHSTSHIFAFDQIPYYPLTHPRFERAYGQMFARNARLSAAAWREARAQTLAFVFEKRLDPPRDPVFAGGALRGLSYWRSALALACAPMQPLLMGKGWGAAPGRFVLDDWHGDKLAQLDGQARLIGALENTHETNYLTEKLFDAFACGGMPVYCAGPGHGVHRLGLPAASWINLWDMTPEQGAAHLAQAQIDPGAMAQAQGALARRLGDGALWQHERERVAQAVIAEFERILHEA